MSTFAPARVLIAGGGFAALETGLALRALAGDRVDLTFLAPEPRLHYRPAATREVFAGGAPRAYDLAAIAGQLEATLIPAALDAVASRHSSVRLSTGMRLYYDALVLAVGARAVTSVAGARTFRDQRDVGAVRALLDGLYQGQLRRLVFAVPAGSTWPLPLYELALRAAGRARDLGLDAEISLVTPEREPLAGFGGEVSRAVGELLREREIAFRAMMTPVAVRRDGALELQADGALPADRVITVPQLRARRISGVPASWWGFVPTDAAGRVEGLRDVYAAGDMTAFPVKQGGLTAQQADAVAETIAAELGAPVRPPRAGRVLRARLDAGSVELHLRAELDWCGRPTASAVEHRRSGSASEEKVMGRYLAPYLAAADRVREPRPSLAV